jgi:hypothetical protein
MEVLEENCELLSNERAVGTADSYQTVRRSVRKRIQGTGGDLCRHISSHSCGNGEIYLLRYNVVWSFKNQQTFRRNVSPQRILLANCFHDGFLLGLFHPEDGSEMFL